MYLDFAFSYLSSLSYTPPPLENFWELMEKFDWPNGGDEAFAQRVNSELSFFDAMKLEHQINELGDELQEKAVAAIKAGGLEPETKFWSEDLWDAARHVVGLGQEAYFEMFDAPEKILEVEASPGLGYCIDGVGRVYEATDQELDEVLRQSSIRPFDSPDGFGTEDVIEHDELGLGFVSFSVNSPWMWVIFRDETLSTQRSGQVHEEVTLYRSTEKGWDFWYGVLGGFTGDIFIRQGSLGSSHGGRIVPPSADAEKRFAQLVEDAKELGFTDEGPKETPFAIHVSEIGLEDDAQVVRFQIDRVLRETGVGRVTHVRVARDTTMFFGTTVDARRAGFTVSKAWDEPPDFSVFDLSNDEPDQVAGESLSFEMETPPVEIHEALPYFSRLSIHPDAETQAWAVRMANQSPVDSLEQIDAYIADRRDERDQGDLTDGVLVTESEILGAFIGQALGGTWGIGTLFGEQIPKGVLVGPAEIRFWPVREVRDRIEGETSSLNDLCDSIVERSNAPPKESTDRTYKFAADQGYYDAGKTSDGRQALMAAFYTDTFALFFDAEGHLTEYATRPSIEDRPADQPEYGPSRMALELWQEELGFKPERIEVKRFSVRSAGVGIEDLPSHYEEFLENPDSFDDEDREHYPDDIRRWIENESFVLYWGNDYWFDGDGNVTSS